MAEGLIAGFERRRLPGDGIEIDALVGGSGPPLLLLHGYPQTRMMWKAVAPRLAEHFTCVIPDLRGYGRSDKPAGDPEHRLYSKRVMARDQIATMRALGHERFAVAGHDRGGRVAYRLALDHPGAVTHLAVLDIIPTAEVWANANAKSAMGVYHWYLLPQPAPLPEKLIGGDPDCYVRRMLESLAADGFQFDPECLEDYLSCFRDPASIHGTCEDYRAGWGPDRAYDEGDRAAGRRITAPTLALWGADYTVAKARPLETWGRWCENVRGEAMPCGHFVCDEAPEQVARALIDFFSG